MKRIIIAISIIMLFSFLAAADYVIIVNKANGIGSISSTDLQNIYSGKKTTWSDGKNIAACFNNGDAQADFLKEAIKKTLPQYQTFWKKAVFTGTGNPPKELGSDAAVKNYVANNPNAIGFISASSLDATIKKIDLK